MISEELPKNTEWWLKLLIITGIQVLWTAPVLMVIHMVFAFLDMTADSDGLPGIFVAGIMGVIVTGLTIGLCLMIGLPLRLHSGLKAWWAHHFYIAPGLALLGIVALLCSWLPGISQTITLELADGPQQHLVPNWILSAPGWFLTAFGLLHLVIPRRRKQL